MTLKNPEKHSFHCLLDVPLCSESGYLVLTDKDETTGMHCLGYRLEETDAVLSAGRAAGRSPTGQADDCTSCTGDQSSPNRGFRATVKGTVKELGDGTDSITGVPVLSNIQVLDESVGCDTMTTVKPICLPALVTEPVPVPKPSVPEPSVPEPVPEPVSGPETPDDCSSQMCETELTSDYQLRYQINVPSGTTPQVCEGCTISMELVYDGKAWVAVAFSENGRMIGSEAVM